ncbi:hypothetical protein [Actinacidiphila glaucinigra]|uniref:hypothetical protein n=1 Tax=Actinacidiphila glaucinigra TaxID=235986 RepID=UPI0029B3550B|nr:hypothetical protein [Streptomyces sp. PA03-3a]
MSQDTPVQEQVAPVPDGPPVRPPRRRGRTTLLIACAAVLGVLAGAGAGYQIQYDRPETPLPPLAQHKLVQPKGAAPAAKPLTAAEDTLVTSDGDLRKLLLKRPKGAKDWTVPYGEDGWVSLYDYADTFKDPSWVFTDLLNGDFRRLAAATWKTGSGSSTTTTEIRLVQFRDEYMAVTPLELEGQQEYMPTKKYAGYGGSAIPGTRDGRVWVYTKEKAGYLPVHMARALARKGNVMIDIWMSSGRPISESTIKAVAKRQWERM